MRRSVRSALAAGPALLVVLAVVHAAGASASSSGTRIGTTLARPRPLASPSPGVWLPPLASRWQYQLESSNTSLASTGGIDTAVCKVPFTGGPCVHPDVFDIDLYVDPNVAGSNRTVDTAAVNAIHANGGHAICYVSAGTAEKWRPDYQRYVDFNASIGGKLFGKPFSSVFPNEYWLNIHNGDGQRDFMLGMVDARTAKCAQAGFDGVEYDIVDAYAQGSKVTGFHITASTQLTFDEALAAIAHSYGLSVALKNDVGQLAELEPYFDYAVNEQCFQYAECTNNPSPGYRSFLNAGKPVFQVEYQVATSAFCSKANALGVNSIKKAKDFSLAATPWAPCR